MNEKDGPSIWIESSGGEGKRTRLDRELATFWLRHPNSKIAKRPGLRPVQGQVGYGQGPEVHDRLGPHRRTCAPWDYVLLDEEEAQSRRGSAEELKKTRNWSEYPLTRACVNGIHYYKPMGVNPW